MGAKRARRVPPAAALAALMCLSVASAQEPDESNSLMLGRTLSVGIAAGLMRFDTNFKFTDRDNDVSVFLDAEGTLGLPEAKAMPLL